MACYWLLRRIQVIRIGKVRLTYADCVVFYNLLASLLQLCIWSIEVIVINDYFGG